MIGDGDVSAVISSVIQTSNIDMYYGIGGLLKEYWLPLLYNVLEEV